MPKVLDNVLGSEARVRVVRFLTAESDRASSVSEIARDTGLTKQGVLKALQQLVAQGVVVRAGSGRSNVYAFRPDSPLLEPLRALFDSETTHAASALSELRQVLAHVDGIDSAWVTGWPESASAPLELHILARPAALAQVGRETREALLPLEAELDRVIEILVHTRAELDDVDTASVTTLAGTPVGASAYQQAATVTKAERRAVTMLTMAKLVEERPSLRGRAERHLGTLLQHDQGLANSDLHEWQQILETYSDQRLADFLRSGSSRAMRLYQSMPFLAVLTPAERTALTDAFEEVGNADRPAGARDSSCM